YQESIMKISILSTIALSLLMVGCGGSNSDKKNTQPSSAANSSSSVTQSSDSSQSASAESSSSESSSSDSSSSAVSSSAESSSSSSTPSGAWACPASGLYFCDDFAQNNHAQWTLKAATDNSSGPNGVFDIADDNGNFMLRYTAASTGGVLAV